MQQIVFNRMEAQYSVTVQQSLFLSRLTYWMKCAILPKNLSATHTHYDICTVIYIWPRESAERLFTCTCSRNRYWTGNFVFANRGQLKRSRLVNTSKLAIVDCRVIVENVNGSGWMVLFARMRFLLFVA